MEAVAGVSILQTIFEAMVGCCLFYLFLFNKSFLFSPYWIICLWLKAWPSLHYIAAKEKNKVEYKMEIPNMGGGLLR